MIIDFVSQQAAISTVAVDSSGTTSFTYIVIGVIVSYFIFLLLR